METDDNALAMAAGGGDRAAFAALIDRHYDRIFRFAWRLTGAADQAEDLAQDVSILLARRIRQFRGDAKFTTWLYQVTLNAARDAGRRNATRGKATGGFFFPDPWSKNGITYPTTMQPLWDLISKKVQAHATSAIKRDDLLKGFRICRQFNLPMSLYRKIALQLIVQKINTKTQWKLPGIFDLFLFEILLTKK